MRIKLIIILCIFLFLCLTKSYALKSPEFIDYLSQKIYEDCKNLDINIKPGFLLDRRTNEPFTILKQPYSYVQVRKIIELFSQNEPYDRYSGGISMGSSMLAKKILTCGGHALDINYDDYYWNDVKK